LYPRDLGGVTVIKGKPQQPKKLGRGGVQSIEKPTQLNKKMKKATGPLGLKGREKVVHIR